MTLLGSCHLYCKTRLSLKHLSTNFMVVARGLVVVVSVRHCAADKRLLYG